MADLRPPIESGAPDPMPYMHPVMKKNYGKWVFHSHPKPGVLFHRAESGDAIWTVKAGTQRQMDTYTIRELSDIADKFGDGYVRFTARSNIEYMVADEAKVEPLIKALNDAGHPVGGTANSVSMIAHTQGWLHCDIPGTDASGVVKALMDVYSCRYRGICWWPGGDYPLLQNLSPHTGMAFIYVQHLSPDHKSILTSLLSRLTEMPVQEIDDMEKMRPDNVYVIPYNKEIEVVDGHIRLIPRPLNKSSNLSIDVLFSSLGNP